MDMINKLQQKIKIKIKIKKKERKNCKEKNEWNEIKILKL